MEATHPTLSIVVPVLNEAQNIETLLASLFARMPGSPADHGVELIVVDGGSSDDTIRLARAFGDCSVIESAPGRALQMNTGAESARGELVLFLHADTILPDDFLALVTHDFQQSDKAWGRFDVRLSGEHSLFRMIEYMMNHRSRLTGISTGDQAIFVRREIFKQLGGFAEIPLMEDIDLSKRLKRISKPFCIHQQASTSSRRWEQHGIIKTILLMWRLRLMYFVGFSAESLSLKYRSSSLMDK